MPRKSRNIEGICHLCGEEGKLSFEHVPPKAAFNNKRTIQVQLEDLIKLGPDEFPKGPEKQGGVGDYTLCERCNSITGHWYGRYFVDLCYQGFELLSRTNGKPSLYYLYYIFPLPVIKQIMAMFFSVTHPGFSDANKELVSFVLCKEKKYLPKKYRLYIYLNPKGQLRYHGIIAKANICNGETNIFSEITYPPFGYVLTIDSKPPDERLYDITHFTRYNYNDFKVMQLRLPVLPTHRAELPGDYRTEEEINEAYLKSLAFEETQKKNAKNTAPAGDTLAG